MIGIRTGIGIGMGRHGALSNLSLPMGGLQIMLSGRRDNLLAFSETFSNAAWVKGATTYSSGALLETNINSKHGLTQVITVPVGGTVYAYTVWAKASTANRFLLKETTSGGATAAFDLLNGTVLSTELGGVGSITLEADGYYRCTMSCSFGAGGKAFSLYLLPDVGTVYADASYQGVATHGILIQKAEFNAGTIPYVYTATTDLVTWANPYGTSGTLMNGTVWTGNAVRFDGSDDYIASLPAKSAAWSVIWANTAHSHGIDSTGATYVDGMRTNTVDADIRTAGAFSGNISFYLQYDHVITGNEHSRVHQYIKRQGVTWASSVLLQSGLDATGASATNPASPLTVPTYVGTGEATHPSIRYTLGGWNGHKYWMAYSAYKSTVPTHEATEVAVSDDGINWSIPAGGASPVIANGNPTINTDPELAFSGDGLTLYLLNRSTSGTAEVLEIRSSTNGITWSDPTTIISGNNTDNYISPSLYFDGTTWHLWAYNTTANKVRHYTASTILGTWSAGVDCNNIASTVRHLSVDHFDGYYRLWLNGTINTAAMQYYVSVDGTTFAKSTVVGLSKGTAGNWDDTIIYRPSPLRDPTGLWLYYGAQDATSKWHIGRAAIALK